MIKVDVTGVLGATGFILALGTVPALAHHSFSMFDSDKTATVNGTVKELEWTNPHAWLHLTVTD